MIFTNDELNLMCMHISIFYVSEQGCLLLFCYAVIAFGIYETETPCLVSFAIP